jgi:hypothetical protein
MQNLPLHPVPVAQNVQPWGAAVADAVGNTYTAQTDQGNNVNVWRPDIGVPRDHRYWCHGHATLSYWLHNYSIYSGNDMETVLADEWFRVDKKPDVGDIIVFRARRTTADYNAGTILHTARIEVSNKSWGSRTAIRLSSKNGPQRIRFDLTPEQVLNDYRETRWFQTEVTCCSTERTNKQYYRRRNGAVGVGAFLGLGYDYLH